MEALALPMTFKALVTRQRDTPHLQSALGRALVELLTEPEKITPAVVMLAHRLRPRYLRELAMLEAEAVEWRPDITEAHVDAMRDVRDALQLVERFLRAVPHE